VVKRRCRFQSSPSAEKTPVMPISWNTDSKQRADWKKVLEYLWSRKKITKKAHAGRGQETK
jgi:hypothetical protein